MDYRFCLCVFWGNKIDEYSFTSNARSWEGEIGMLGLSIGEFALCHITLASAARRSRVRLHAFVRPTPHSVQCANSTVRPARSAPLISERQVSPAFTDCAVVTVPVVTISPALKGA